MYNRLLVEEWCRKRKKYDDTRNYKYYRWNICYIKEVKKRCFVNIVSNRRGKIQMFKNGKDITIEFVNFMKLMYRLKLKDKYKNNTPDSN